MEEKRKISRRKYLATVLGVAAIGLTGLTYLGLRGRLQQHRITRKETSQEDTPKRTRFSSQTYSYSKVKHTR